MQVGIRQAVRTRPETDFTAACLHGAAFAMAQIPLPKSLSQRIVLKNLHVAQVQDIVWALNFFSTAAGSVAAFPNADMTFLGRAVFLDANVKIAGAGLFLQTLRGLDMLLFDYTSNVAAGGAQSNINVILENIDGAQDKAADAAGALELVFDLEYAAER